MIFPNCRGKRPSLPIPETWKQNHYLLYHLHANKDIKSRCFLPFKPLVFYELAINFRPLPHRDTCRWLFTGRSDAVAPYRKYFPPPAGSTAGSIRVDTFFVTSAPIFHRVAVPMRRLPNSLFH